MSHSHALPCLLLLFLLTTECQGLPPKPLPPSTTRLQGGLGSSSSTATATGRSSNNPSSSSSSNNNVNLNFEDWITDDTAEVQEWQDVAVVTTFPDDSGNKNSSNRIPSFLRGTLVRNGPGFWTGPNGQERYSHLFDGIAKWSAYRISSNTSSDSNNDNHQSDNDIQVQYKTQFVQSQFYREIIKTGRLVPTIGVGPILSTTTATGGRVVDSAAPISLWRMMQAIINSVRIFDNAPVNVWDYNPNNNNNNIINDADKPQKTTTKTLTGLTDAPARSILSLDNLETCATFMRSPIPIENLPLGYVEFLSTAHPAYSLVTDDTYNIILFLTVLDGPVIGLVKEYNGGTRRRLVAQAKIADGTLPYTHSFGISTKYAVVVLQPLRVDVTDIHKSLSVGFLRGMLSVDETIVLVFDLETGQCVLNQAMSEKIYFYHTASTAEWENEKGEPHVSIRLCAYKTPDIITGDDQFMRLERCAGNGVGSGKEARNRLSRGGTFCDVVCNIHQQTVAVIWKAMPGNQGFEFPMTRFSRAHGPPAAAVVAGAASAAALHNNNKSHTTTNTNKHPRFVYGIGHYAFGSDEYDSAALFKFEPETGQIAASYSKNSMYFSEPIVVANSEASSQAGSMEEDEDCVVLSQVYNGITRETGLLVLNAKTLKPLAEVWTGRRSPMDFHGVWVPHDAWLNES
jgi:carotenoid cleavage dioxygenase-like enzyme